MDEERDELIDKLDAQIADLRKDCRWDRND